MEELKIHIGCGKRDFGDKWVHIDGDTSFKHVKNNDIYLFGYNNNTVDEIYASHFIEYFDRQEVVELLKCWKNALKEGGILKLAVPNFPVLVEIYQKYLDLDIILGPLFGRMKMDAKTIYHKTCYDYISLYNVLSECGFKNIKTWNWQETEHSHIDDHSQAYFPHMNKKYGTLISLNMLCKK